MTLGQRIQKERAALGLSQEALGEKLGVTRQSVSKWEADAAVPDTDKLITLSKFFHMTLNELLQVKEPAPANASAAQPDPSPAPEPSPPSKHKRDIARALSAVLALLLLAALAFSLLRLRRLETRITQLEANLQAQSAPWEAPSVADFQFQLSFPGSYASGSLTYQFDLTPDRFTPDATVTFLITHAGDKGDHTVEANTATGHYTASGTLAATDYFLEPLNITAIFSNGSDTSYSVPLVRITSHTSHSYTWDSLWDN